MSCTDTHSSREWKFCSPAKMFGVGSPMNDSLDPSVPPRIARSRIGTPARANRLARAFDDDRVMVDHLAHVAVRLVHLDSTTRPVHARDDLRASDSSHASFSFRPAVTKSRISNLTVV